jgi:hypothetical protein
MGARYREFGGGPAVGVADEWAQMLQSLMRGGSTPGIQFDRALTNNTPGSPTNPVTGSGGIGNVLQSILSPGAGQVGGSLQEIIQRDTERQRNALRAQYGATGSSFGSGAAQTEALFSAEAAPRAALGIGNLQLQVLAQILPLLNSFAGRGVSQRSGALEQNPILQGIDAASGLIGAAGTLAGGSYNRGNRSTVTTLGNKEDKIEAISPNAPTPAFGFGTPGPYTGSSILPFGFQLPHGYNPPISLPSAGGR